MSIANEYKTLNMLIERKKKEITAYTERKKKELDPFTTRQKELAKQLYEYMKKNDLEYYQGVSIESVAPKQKQVKEKISREDQMIKLRQMGIRNPDEALKEMGL